MSTTRNLGIVTTINSTLSELWSSTANYAAIILRNLPGETPPPVRPRPSTKRKCDIDNEKAEGGMMRKERKVLGRPRNAWTASRSRKLVRLFLMTSLDVDAIVEVLRTKHFKPCKRDVQKQLQTLLQSRPGKIRSRGVMTKARLRLLRECRALEAANLSQIKDMRCGYETVKTSTTSASSDFDLVSICYSQPTTDSSRLASVFGTNRIGSSSTSIADESWSDTDEGENYFNHYKDRLGLSDPNALSQNHHSSTSTITSLPSVTRGSPPIHDQLLSERCSSPSPSSSTVRPVKSGKRAHRNTTLTTTVTAVNSQGSFGADPHISPSPMDGSRLITFTMESCQTSVASDDSLRNRLASKSDSCVQDVISVLHNFSISGPSEALGKPDLGRSLEESSSTLLIAEKRDQDVSKKAETIVALPFISQEEILQHHKLHLPGYSASLSLMPINPSCVSTLEHENISFPLRDPFGHTILHMAAASGERPQHLLELINFGADVHGLNSGGETFLHLVSNVTSEDYIHLGYLLHNLQIERFDFHHRDDHGQTALHVLTRGWEDDLAFESIADNLLLYEISLPSCRDNLGRTILGQMKGVGLRIPSIDHLEDRATIYNKARSQSIQFNEDDIELPTYQINDTQIYGRLDYESPTHVKSIVYDVHAKLLRTILKATSSPQHEDEHGRNGLHCLAEVSLILPIPIRFQQSTATAHAFPSRREAFLQDLLEVGVDPDNCDKAGITPLMAFIIHTREDEDDDTTSRILARLLNAGANINRRDRSGQTPLHLAVKLGKVAVTRFLLSHGSNIHARNSDGRGVIATGKAHSMKASSSARLYAQIMMCISCVADAGAVSAPTLLQEWGYRL